MKDLDKTEIGYAYYRRTCDPEGKHVSTVLFQCEADPNRADVEDITRFLLHTVFDNYSDDIRRVISNLPKKQSEMTHKVLESFGFTAIAKQVFMIKDMY